MGTIVTNIVKTTILRLQQPPAYSLFEPVVIEKLDTFHIDRYELGRVLSDTFGINISPDEIENWQTVGNVIETAEKRVTAAAPPIETVSVSYTEAVNKADTIIEHRLRMADRARLIDKLMKGE